MALDPEVMLARWVGIWGLMDGGSVGTAYRIL